MGGGRGGSEDGLDGWIGNRSKSFKVLFWSHPPATGRGGGRDGRNGGRGG